MADANSGSFRSKHAGKPGSLVAIRVDYPLSTSAFQPLVRDTEQFTRHAEVRKFARGQRIGDRSEWNASTVHAKGKFPDRPTMRALSEYQAVKMDYNYRASVLPSVNHNTTFVPKPNKVQIDKSLFLTATDRSKLVERCPGTTAKLSRVEITNEGMDGFDREVRWNGSTFPADERHNIFKQKKYESFVDFNKTKDNVLDPSRYSSPQQRFAISAESMRSQKLLARTDNLSRTATTSPILFATMDGAPAVFKMSNIREWWDKCPVPLPERSATTPADLPHAADGSDAIQMMK